MLTTPKEARRYLFGAEVTLGWKVGSPITYKGVWEGEEYEDKGTMVAIEPLRLLESTCHSPLSGKEDKPENYATIIYELIPEGDAVTSVTVTQEDNSTEGADQAERNWDMALGSLKSRLKDTDSNGLR